MTEFKLEVTKREGQIKRTSKEIPAVVYGKHFKNESIVVDTKAFNLLFREAGTSNLVDIVVDGGSPIKTLIHDSQKNPVTGEIIHVDFLKVNMKEKIHAEIPLTFVGESTAVIDLEGSLITPIDSIEVECLPGDLPSEIEIDISVLDDFEKNIKVSDIKVPTGVEILSEPEEILAFVQEPRSEEEMAELEEEIVEDVSAVEIENKGEEAVTEGNEDDEKKVESDKKSE